MLKLLIAFILLFCFGCTEEINDSIDLNSTFVLDSSFTVEQQQEIIDALFDWEQVTRGLVNNKIIISDHPNMYDNSYPKIIKSEVLDPDRYARTYTDVNHTTITVYYKLIDTIGFKHDRYNLVTLKGVMLHEFGHAFGLKHRNRGVMADRDAILLCIDTFTLEQFCEIHNCSMNEVQTNCQQDIL